ncbi:mCG145531, partial [Mus musculus]
RGAVRLNKALPSQAGFGQCLMTATESQPGHRLIPESGIFDNRPDAQEPARGGRCTQQGSLPTSINTTKTLSHKHTQSPTSQAILDADNVTVDTVHHRGLSPLLALPGTASEREKGSV